MISLKNKLAFIVLLTAFSCHKGENVEGIHFKEIKSGHFVQHKASTGGVSWVDIDVNGFTDLFIANGYDTSQPNTPPQDNFMYLNQNRKFELKGNSISTYSGFSSSSSWADYDNDGDLDVFITNQKNTNNWLFKQNDAKEFILDSLNIVSTDGGASFSADWVDIDNDGLLDLYVSNGGFTRRQPDFLYKNIGNGHFEKITQGPIVIDSIASVGGVWGDYDNDGLRDLILPNTQGAATLYKNLGGFEFIKVDDTVIKLSPKHGFGSSSSAQWVDYDNDLDLDLFIFNQYGLASQLYNNQGDGTFKEVEDNLIVNLPSNAGAGLWADYDNDGDQDLLCSNWGSSFIYYENDNEQFKALLELSFSKSISYTSSMAVADYDNDGDLDVYVGNWPNKPGNGEKNRFFVNENSNGNNWIKIKLVGTKSNRDGIGAKITLTYEQGGKIKKQFKEVTLTSNFRSQSDIIQHFGLGRNGQIKSIEIVWPSGMQTTTESLEINMLNKIVEE